MPTKTSQRWINDGDAVKSQLEALGYTVDLQYAQDDIPNQLSQLENEITKGPKALIIASIDGTTMSDALQKAADAGVVVVAYDRLIKKTGNVDYYTTFDNFGVGVIQANSLVKGLKERFPNMKAVERRTVRRFAGRQQRLLLLQRRHVGPAAADRRRARSRSSPARWAWTRSARCVGSPPPPRPAWTTCSRPTTRTAAASMACCRPMTACRAASSPRCAPSVTARTLSPGRS